MNVESEPVERFGPFLAIASRQIHHAGWSCRHCRQPVRRFATAVPDLFPRILFFACRCGCVATFEDERRPTKKTWPDCVRLLKNSGAGMVVFNGGKDIPPGFQGLN